MTTVDEMAAPRWQRTLYVLFIAQLFTAVGFSSIFPFLPLYVKALGATSGLSIELLAGLVFSAQAFTMMLASPIWGALADRLGRKLMVERAMFGGAVILLMMAFARSAEELVFLRAVQGLITGTVAAANALAASSTPRQHVGYAMGLLQVGLGSGVALGPLIGGMVADTYGYAAAFYITAAMLFLSGLLVWWGVEETLDPIEVKNRASSSFIGEWSNVLATPGVISTFSMRFFSQLGRMTILPIVPLFVETLVDDPTHLNTLTGLVIGCSSAATTISSVFLGRLGDRIGHRHILTASALTAACLYIFQSYVNAAWQLLVLQSLVGVTMGGIIPSISALLANYTPLGEAGAVYGLDNSIDAGGRALAPLLGSMVAYSLSLRATFVSTALFFLGTALVALRFLPAHIKPGESGTVA